nr:hypothetical protein Iba_chr09fCG11820 [Ipomoea batatas]
MDLEGLFNPRITSELHLTDPISDSDYELDFRFSNFDDDGYVERFERARGHSGARACGGHKRRRGHYEFRIHHGNVWKKESVEHPRYPAPPGDKSAKEAKESTDKVRDRTSNKGYRPVSARGSPDNIRVGRGGACVRSILRKKKASGSVEGTQGFRRGGCKVSESRANGGRGLVSGSGWSHGEGGDNVSRCHVRVHGVIKGRNVKVREEGAVAGLEEGLKGLVEDDIYKGENSLGFEKILRHMGMGLKES